MTQKLAVPAFFKTPSHFADFDTLKKSAPPGTIIVLDASISSTQPPDVNDPGTQAFWQGLVQGYQAGGINITVLGYINSDNGSQRPGFTQSDIFTYINQWYTLCPTLDGIFFDLGPEPDVVPITSSVISFYHAIYGQVQTKSVRPGHPQIGGNTSGPTVLLNASQYEDDNGFWIMEDPNVQPPTSNRACDIAILWETDASKYLTTAPRPTNVYPTNPPTWWTDPRYSPDRIAHTIHHCSVPVSTLLDPDPNINLLQSLQLMCQVVSQSQIRGAGYVYVFDDGGTNPTDTSYPFLAQYWNQEVATVTWQLRDNNDVYVRDWTDSPNSYDQGVEPSTNPVFWTTSDVWNRLSNAPGGFNANDQPINEDPQLNALGNNTNFAFARIHRKPCGGTLTVTASFLWADYGAGGIFQNVSATPSVTVTFNPGDTEIITPGVQWTLPANNSNHVCMAVEVFTPQDPLHLGDELRGQSSGPATGSLVIKDNNIAQRNLFVVRIPSSPMPSPFSDYATAHNGDLFPRDMVFTYEIIGAVQEILGDAFIEVIDVQGKRISKPFTSGDMITLEDMQPGENRWVGLTAQVQGGSEGQVLPVTFYELVENRVVNGFTTAVQPSPLSTVMLANLNLHALELRRIAAAFEIDDAEDEIEDALELFRKDKISSYEYMLFLRSHIPIISRVIYELGWSQVAGDPFGIRNTLKYLIAAVKSDTLDHAISTHTQVLQKLDAFITMLQKAQGDTADILQMVRWQRELYRALPSLKAVKGAHHLVEESQAFITAYQARQIDNDRYPHLIGDLLHVFHQTAEAVEEALEQDIATMEQNVGSLTSLQKTHRAYLLKLQHLGSKQ